MLFFVLPGIAGVVLVGLVALLGAWPAIAARAKVLPAERRVGASPPVERWRTNSSSP